MPLRVVSGPELALRANDGESSALLGEQASSVAQDRDTAAHLVTLHNVSLVVTSTKSQQQVEKANSFSEGESGQWEPLLFLNPSPGSLSEKSSKASSLSDSQAGKTAKVSHSPKKLHILENVNASFRSGEMTLIIGRSGSGKTALLDVLAGYKVGGTLLGDVRLDGTVRKDALAGSSWRRETGYAEHHDFHFSTLSVWESLLFSTRCRLPAASTEEICTAKVQRVIGLLGLEEYTNVIVECLPKFQLKCLTVGVEICAGPKALFLDSPTAGLNIDAAQSLVSALKSVTVSEGIVTVATLSNASQKIFEAFDKLLVLDDGAVAYHGRIGPNSEVALEFARECAGAPAMEEGANPAEYMLTSCQRKQGAYQSSALYRKVLEDLQTIVTRAQNEERAPHKANTEPRSGWFKQFGLIASRHFKTRWRNTDYAFERLIWTVSSSFIMAIGFLSLGNGVIDAILFMGVLFLAIFTVTVPMMQVVIPLIEERGIVYRELASGTYKHTVYPLACMVAEMPMHAVNAFLFWSILYYAVGFRDETEYSGYFFLVVLFTHWALPLLAQLLAVLSPNVETATALITVVMLFCTLLMGFLIPHEALPDGWEWAYWTDILRYPFEGLVQNQLIGFTFELSAVLDISVPNNITINATTALGLPDGLVPILPKVPDVNQPISLREVIKALGLIVALLEKGVVEFKDVAKDAAKHAIKQLNHVQYVSRSQRRTSPKAKQ